MNIQVLKTEDGGELVVMSRREFDALLARAGDEDAEDRMTLLLAAEARAEAPLPAPVSAALLAGESLVRALRKWRGMTQSQLATASGINQGYLSEVENGTKNAAPETLAKIATALDLPSGWL
jgi:DNA-binding XRE family transcriptional regulator